mmetsp:Transcript_39393/g.66039  ORF Transcript_39393/g.66039 Transcript_39393/m.66039 type:complete len:111 (+) Transcript_39393:107-439(+)
MSCNDKCDIWPFLLLNQSGKGKKKASGFLDDLLQYQMVSQLLGCSTDSSCSIFPSCSTSCSEAELKAKLAKEIIDLGNPEANTDKQKKQEALVAQLRALGVPDASIIRPS